MKDLDIILQEIEATIQGEDTLSTSEKLWIDTARNMKESAEERNEPMADYLDLIRDEQLIAHCILPSDRDTRLSFISSGSAYAIDQARLVVDAWVADPDEMQPGVSLREQAVSRHALIFVFGREDNVTTVMNQYAIDDHGQIEWGLINIGGAPPEDAHSKAVLEALDRKVPLEALVAQGKMMGLDEEEAITHFHCAVTKALLRVYGEQAAILLAASSERAAEIVRRSMNRDPSFTIMDPDEEGQ